MAKRSNQEIIGSLIEHLKLGKPILNRRRKAIGERTAHKYLLWLNKLDGWLGKPFEDVTDRDVDSFRKRLKNDVIRANSGKPYDDSSKYDIEVKFLRVLLQYIGKQELSLFITSYETEAEIPAISKEEVETIVSQAKLRDKVIFQLLFDGGFRADEFLNVRFSDLKTDALLSQGYYKVRITKSKTIARTVGLTLPSSSEVLKAWLEANKAKIGTSELLVDISYRHLNLTVKRHGDKVLKKKLTPHMLRHSSATYYCHHLNQYQMCKRYGWSMVSDMPKRYIDREGIDDETINAKVMQEEVIPFKHQVNKLQEQLSIKDEQMKAMQEEFSNRLSDFEKNMPDMIKELMQVDRKDLLKAKRIILSKEVE